MFTEFIFIFSLSSNGHDLRIHTIITFQILAGSILFAVPVFFTLFYLLRYRTTKSDSFVRSVVLSSSFTITSFLGFLAFLIYSLLILLTAEGYYDSFLMIPLLPMSFYLVLTVSFFIWYRFHIKSLITKGEDVNA